MGKVKFQSSWQKSRPWLKAHKNNVHQAICTACNAELDVSAGVCQITNHESRKKHKDSIAKMSGQSTFTVSGAKLFLQASNRLKVLSTEDQILKAEIIRCIDIIDSNVSFSSAENDSEKYARMFPDSDIAKGYKQKRCKVKYMIQFGIAPVLRKASMKDISGNPYTFKFDETTTSQTKKQYDAYGTYFSPTNKQVQTIYLYTLFVGRCTAQDLLGHYNEMSNVLDLDTNYCMTLGMDGPNVNKSFQNLLNEDLKEKGKKLIDVGTCPLHIISNAFLEGLKVLVGEVDLNKFAVDLHSFFKYSAKRVQDFLDVQKETETHARKMTRHVTTRWISIQSVLVKILDQFLNLKTYFLETLPREKGFNYKNGVGNSDRYKSIKGVLMNKKLQSIMAAVAYIAQDFKSFVLPLQAVKPMIPVLHQKLRKLLQSLFSKFLNDEVYMHNGKLVSMKRNSGIDLSEDKNLKARCDVGTRATAELRKLDALEQKKVYQLMSKFFIAVTSYLVDNLPLQNKVIQQARYLQPSMQQDDRISENVCSLLEYLWKALGQTIVTKIFSVPQTKSLFDLKDALRKEVTEYKLEKIPEDESPVVEEISSRRSCQSYWREAYGLVGLDYYEKKDTSFEIEYDQYWLKVKGLKDEEGKLKFLHLATLALVVLSLPHGNADPERGFSINKHLLEKHGPNVEEDTIIAIRTIKDHLIRCGGQSKIEITSEMLESCRNARESYARYLQNRQKEEAIKQAEEQKKKDSQELQKTIAEIDEEIASAKLRLGVSEKLVEEGNSLLKACTKKMHIPTFTEGQQKLELGLNRKRKIEEEIATLEKRRKTVSKK